MKVLKFTKHSKPYKVGDIAGFSPKDAARYLKAKVAVEHTPDAKSVDEASEDKAIKSPAKKK